MGDYEIKKGDSKFVSGVVVITEDNGIHFLNPKSRKIQLSKKVLKVPGENARIYDDQFCESAIYFINDK
jgi:hypothetical protein